MDLDPAPPRPASPLRPRVSGAIPRRHRRSVHQTAPSAPISSSAAGVVPLRRSQRLRRRVLAANPPAPSPPQPTISRCSVVIPPRTRTPIPEPSAPAPSYGADVEPPWRRGRPRPHVPAPSSGAEVKLPRRRGRHWHSVPSTAPSAPPAPKTSFASVVTPPRPSAPATVSPPPSPPRPPDGMHLYRPANQANVTVRVDVENLNLYSVKVKDSEGRTWCMYSVSNQSDPTG